MTVQHEEKQRWYRVFEAEAAANLARVASADFGPEQWAIEQVQGQLTSGARLIGLTSSTKLFLIRMPCEAHGPGCENGEVIRVPMVEVMVGDFARSIPNSRRSRYEDVIYRENLIAKYTAWGLWGAAAVALVACLSGKARIRLPATLFAFSYWAAITEDLSEDILRKIHAGQSLD